MKIQYVVLFARLNYYLLKDRVINMADENVNNTPKDAKVTETNAAADAAMDPVTDKASENKKKTGNKKQSKKKKPDLNEPAAKKKLIKRIVLLILLILFIIYVVSCTMKTKDALQSVMNSDSKEVLEERDLKNTISATGKVVSKETRSYSSTVTGVEIEQLNVALGDSVSAGDILAVLDDSDLKENLDDAQVSRNAAAGSSSISVESANRTLANAKETQAVDQTRADQKISDAIADYNDANAELKDAIDAMETAQSNYDSASSNVDSAKAARDAAQAAAAEAESRMAAVSNEFIAVRDSMVVRLSDYAAYDSTASDAGKDKFNLTALQNATIGSASMLSSSSIYTGSNTDISSKIDSGWGDLNGLSKLKELETQYNGYLATYDAQLTAEANAETAYSLAQAQYETAKAAKTSAESTYKSLDKAADSAGDAVTSAKQNKEDVTRSDNMSVASSTDSVKNANLNASTATLSSDSNIRNLEEQIDDCVITSSISGIVTAISGQQGDTYSGGVLITVEDTSSYEIETQIDEFDIPKIRVGQKVVVKTNGTGDETLEGEVSAIAPRATTTTAASGSSSSSVTYKVTIKLLTPNDDIKLDMTAKLSIITEEADGVLASSYDAIQTDEDGNSFVYVLEDPDYITYSELLADTSLSKQYASQGEVQTKKVYITQGLESDFYVQLISDELSPGDTLYLPSNGEYSDLESYLTATGSTGGM